LSFGLRRCAGAGSGSGTCLSLRLLPSNPRSGSRAKTLQAGRPRSAVTMPAGLRKSTKRRPYRAVKRQRLADISRGGGGQVAAARVQLRFHVGAHLRPEPAPTYPGRPISSCSSASCARRSTDESSLGSVLPGTLPPVDRGEVDAEDLRGALLVPGGLAEDPLGVGATQPAQRPGPAVAGRP
jgi:hypothetical protein